MQQLLNQTIHIARQAGDAIMAVYHTDFARYQKQDASPVTEADLAAHKVIVTALGQISDYPVLSEESDPQTQPWALRRQWQTYWLIDPLDGTKEFIQRNDEFTVNIALIHQGKAVLGVVYCPPLDRLYYAAAGLGAFRLDAGQSPREITVAPTPQSGDNWRIVGSRRHGADTLAQFAAALEHVSAVSMGSSLKLCLVAEGSAHLYPRLAPTCEWDTAAAQAIVEQAGGQVLQPDLTPLQYGQKADLLNPFFIVCNRPDPLWRDTFMALSQP
ncbi:3'(2'),5'-bisphosphate nucleotidase CysQ [Shewanella sp. NFH-SH190041]|uniref:3'(2'),5'-bisphosphate nucleotidase CysQ n=1 Tax=Shewanella sp. NFH-SH190041 TaxID=2950245 RepID=UPI0021C3302A|nr:3'(2'),5'-bisphosphate nucleotidase CysQ [Shewanella sp. NFH-SH190041]BDM62825.1 3'(2'),5'-bisphosphate nucleotidase CysQ [Shewanella sp. NFH-SH190041]